MPLLVTAAPPTEAAVPVAGRVAWARHPSQALPRPSFGEVAHEHLDRLYGYCLRLAGSPQDAEDLLQDTFLRAIPAWHRVRDTGRARAWLFTIATNTWRDTLRRRGRQVPTTPIDGGEDDDFSLYQTIAIEDPFPYSDELHLDFLRLFRNEDVQAVFGSIGEPLRLPLILTVIHGFSCKEAAAILGIPLGTVLSRLHRGRKQLERLLWQYAVANGLVTAAEDDSR
jgi:RNA polymerase sigma-70 factor, ECF subfamily